MPDVSLVAGVSLDVIDHSQFGQFHQIMGLRLFQDPIFESGDGAEMNVEDLTELAVSHTLQKIMQDFHFPA